MKDEHGMPLPCGDNPLPWRLCGVFEIMSSNETYVSELGESLGDIDAEFIVHAANNIIPCREIVRRLAETPENMGPTFRAGYVTQLIKEARSLWDKIQRDAKGGSDA